MGTCRLMSTSRAGLSGLWTGLVSYGTLTGYHSTCTAQCYSAARRWRRCWSEQPRVHRIASSAPPLMLAKMSEIDRPGHGTSFHLFGLRCGIFPVWHGLPCAEQRWLPRYALPFRRHYMLRLVELWPKSICPASLPVRSCEYLLMRDRAESCVNPILFRLLESSLC